MAATDFASLAAAQVRLWSAELWQEGRDQSFWFSNGFIGKDEKDMSSPIHRVTKLSPTARGLEVVMQLVSDLDGDGIVGDNELDGNEEAMFNDEQVIRVDQLRHAVKSRGEISEQATVIRFRATAKAKLAFWMPDKIDEIMFLVASGRALTLKLDGSARGASQWPSFTFAADIAAPSSNRIVYAGSATSEATLAAGDKIGWNEIVGVKTTMDRQRIRPLMERGKKHYVFVISSEQMRDLQQDSTYQTIARSADARGLSSNVLFKNAVSNVQGCVIHSHNKVFNTLGLTSGVDKWGSGQTVDGAQALVMGSQALGFATIGETFTRGSDKTDYGNREGIGVGRKLGFLKPRYITRKDPTAQDFGIVSYKTAAAA